MTDNVLRLVIAMLVFIGFFGFQYLLLVMPIPDDVKNTTQQVSTQLVPLLTMVIGYYFGSSAGSASKDKTITDLSGKP